MITEIRKAYWVDCRIEPVYKDNVVTGYTAIKYDISDKKIIEKLSITDGLTQLYNRRYFNQSFKDEIQRAKQSSSYFTFRLEREEFGIIFSGLDVEQSMEFANKVKNNIEALKIPHCGNTVSEYVASFFGLIVQKGEDITTCEELCKVSDKALYLAKESGRNQVKLEVL